MCAIVVFNNHYSGDGRFQHLRFGRTSSPCTVFYVPAKNYREGKVDGLGARAVEISSKHFRLRITQTPGQVTFSFLSERRNNCVLLLFLIAICDEQIQLYLSVSKAISESRNWASGRDKRAVDVLFSLVQACPVWTLFVSNVL